MEYAVQYTISVLEGAYALKYSVVIYDAGRLEGLLKATNSNLVGLAANTKRHDYDPFDCFQGLMKILKKDVKRTFCTSIIKTSNGEQERGTSFCDEDEKGSFVVEAYGLKGICRRGDDVQEFEEIEGKSGRYSAELSTVLKVFKEDLMNLMNLCEETIAKNARLVAQVVPNDTPKPAPLFQL